MPSLLSKSRFGNFQENIVETKFPTVVPDLPLDQPRFDFLTQHAGDDLDCFADVGANKGYFSLRLLQDGLSSGIAFEPDRDVVQILDAQTQALGFTDRLDIRSEPVTITTVNELPFHDLCIHMNVLQHAGDIFDRDAVPTKTAWLKYAQSYLSRLASRCRYCLFQTGNVGRGESLFDQYDVFNVLPSLFEASGFRIASVGYITTLQPPFQYETYTREEIRALEPYRCQREEGSGLVSYRRSGKKQGALSTGLAAVPLWWLHSLARTE